MISHWGYETSAYVPEPDIVYMTYQRIDDTEAETGQRYEVTAEMRASVLALLERSGIIETPSPADEALTERLCRVVLAHL